jgi:hypothetical protein
MRKENGRLRREDEEDDRGEAVLRLLAHPVRDGLGRSGAKFSRNRKVHCKRTPRTRQPRK